MTKNEFYTFIAQLKIITDRTFYMNVVKHHLDIVPDGKKVNLNSYFPEGADRTKFKNMIHYIDTASLLPFKDIFFEDDVFWVRYNREIKRKIDE